MSRKQRESGFVERISVFSSVLYLGVFDRSDCDHEFCK